jgi:hypothetical protein
MDGENSAERLKRKLAVILASDVAGYNRLMSISEDDTVGRFSKAAQTFVQIIEKHEGRVFNTAGDAILAEFSSAVNAVRCGIDFQSINNKENLRLPQERQLLFRIGIAVGDVIVHYHQRNSAAAVTQCPKCGVTNANFVRGVCRACYMRDYHQRRSAAAVKDKQIPPHAR